MVQVWMGEHNRGRGRLVSVQDGRRWNLLIGTGPLSQRIDYQPFPGRNAD